MTDASNPLPLQLEIRAPGRGLPLGLASYLMRAVGLAYPGTLVCNDRGFGAPVLTMLIPAEDLFSPSDVTDEDLAGAVAKDNEALTAFTSGLRDGALGVSPPPWLSALLVGAARDLVDALPPAAENYLACDIHADDGTTFTWIICRPGQPSPHELRRQAETERDHLRDRVLAAVQQAEHEALRWEVPIEPELTCAMVRAALGVPGCGCGCPLCEGAADRWHKHRGTRAPWLPKEGS